MKKTEKIQKVLNNRVTWVITSLLISFFVWVYLAGTDTTTFNQTFYNVPVVFEGADSLRTTKGLIITDPEVSTVTVEVRGSRASIGSLHASELQAVVDVSGISQARETELTYTIEFPDRIKVVSFVSRKALPAIRKQLSNWVITRHPDISKHREKALYSL